MTPNTHRVRSFAMVLVVFATTLTGCSTWQPTSVSPQTIVRDEDPSSIRLTLTNGAVATVADPVLRNDSIVTSSEVAPGITVRNVAFSSIVPGIAVAEVSATEVRQFSLGKTILLVVGGIVAAAAWTTSVVGSGGEDKAAIPHSPRRSRL